MCLEPTATIATNRAPPILRTATGGRRAYLCRQKSIRAMTTIQITSLSADILRNLGIIAQDETLLKRVARYLHRVARERTQQDGALSREEFLRRIEEAERDIAQGKGVELRHGERLDDLLDRIGGSNYAV